MPPSPWIGSTIKAQVLGVIASFSALASPKGIVLKPGVSGPKSFLYSGDEEAEMIVVVRP